MTQIAVRVTVIWGFVTGLMALCWLLSTLSQAGM